MPSLRCLFIAVTCCLGACRDQPAAAAAPAHAASHVDTILPRAEAMRRFQATARRTDTLAGGAITRDALVRNFMQALETRDTAAFRRLVLDRDEFAFLYYPTAPQGLPPYELSPELLWFTLQSGNGKGLARVLSSRGGQALGFQSYRCDPVPSREGANLLWGPCTVRYRKGGQTVQERLFGLMLEREGRFKFVNYANKL